MGEGGLGEEQRRRAEGGWRNGGEVCKAVGGQPGPGTRSSWLLAATVRTASSPSAHLCPDPAPT